MAEKLITVEIAEAFNLKNIGDKTIFLMTDL